MQGPLGFPCLVVEPFDGGDGTRPAQRTTVRTVSDLPDATFTVLPEAIAVGRGCGAPYARHLPTLLSHPLRAVRTLTRRFLDLFQDVADHQQARMRLLPPGVFFL